MGIIKQLCTAAHKTVWSKITIFIMQCNVLYFLYLRECLCIKIEKKKQNEFIYNKCPNILVDHKRGVEFSQIMKTQTENRFTRRPNNTHTRIVQ